jgi:hypothetical protein
VKTTTTKDKTSEKGKVCSCMFIFPAEHVEQKIKKINDT